MSAIKADQKVKSTGLWLGAEKIVRSLREKGHAAFFAGGCVRDLILGIDFDDIDVATDARPEQVQAIFRRTVPVGVQFGVVIVQLKGKDYQVATFRADLNYSDGRHPEGVEFSSPLEDVRRRDFTINGLFLDPDTWTVFDGVDGLADLERKIIRAIGEADRRIDEDKLRMLRAVRFACRLGFEVEMGLRQAIRSRAREISAVSRERVEMELGKILTCERAGEGVAMLVETGLMDGILPEFAARDRDGATRAWSALFADKIKRSEERGYALFLAPFVMTRDLEPLAEWASRLEESIKWFRLSNAMRKTLRNAYEAVFSMKGFHALELSAKKRLARNECMGLGAWFYRAAGAWTGLDPSPAQSCLEFAEKMGPEKLSPSPLLTGADLLEAGMKPGPELGRVLARLEEEQLGEKLFDRNEALLWLREQIHGKCGH